MWSESLYIFSSVEQIEKAWVACFTLQTSCTVRAARASGVCVCLQVETPVTALLKCRFLWRWDLMKCFPMCPNRRNGCDQLLMRVDYKTFEPVDPYVCHRCAVCPAAPCAPLAWERQLAAPVWATTLRLLSKQRPRGETDGSSNQCNTWSCTQGYAHLLAFASLPFYFNSSSCFPNDTIYLFPLLSVCLL